MIGAAAQLRDLDIAIFLAILIIGMYVVPSLIRGVRTYRAGVDLARQLYREREIKLFGSDPGPLKLERGSGQEGPHVQQRTGTAPNFTESA